MSSAAPKRPTPPELAQYTTGQLVNEIMNRSTEAIIVTVFQDEEGQMINHDFNCTWSQALGLNEYLRLRLEHLVRRYQIEVDDAREDEDEGDWWKRK